MPYIQTISKSCEPVSVDDNTWSSLMVGYRERLSDYGCKAFNEGYEALDFNTTKVERIPNLSERVHTACGWTLQAVSGLLPNPEFFGLLDNQIFPVADKIRLPKELAFSELPDLFHDALGHLPLLLTSAYRDFLLKYARVAKKYLDSPTALKYLARLYWYTIETGLIVEEGKLVVYGAATMTSSVECSHALSSHTPKVSFDFETIFSSDYNSFKIQPRYFIVPSLEFLSEIGDEIEESLAKILSIPFDN